MPKLFCLWGRVSGRFHIILFSKTDYVQYLKEFPSVNKGFSHTVNSHMIWTNYWHLTEKFFNKTIFIQWCSMIRLTKCLQLIFPLICNEILQIKIYSLRQKKDFPFHSIWRKGRKMVKIYDQNDVNFSIVT